MKRLIQDDRSVIIAADVPNLVACIQLARATKGVPGISGFKFGIEVGLDGLARANDQVEDIWDGHVVKIYDHQKAGNDIPEMGAKFAKKLKKCGMDAAILFPFTGPQTQREWTKACMGEGLHVIVGGVMTHKAFTVSEGGYIADEAVDRIYATACEQGVTDFVVPGTKLNWVTHVRGNLEKVLGADNFVLYAPGFITQGGDISECGVAAGPHFHAIIGSAIYGKDVLASEQEMRAAALQCTSKLVP